MYYYRNDTSSKHCSVAASALASLDMRLPDAHLGPRPWAHGEVIRPAEIMPKDANIFVPLNYI
jgi:hypothetical protein